MEQTRIYPLSQQDDPPAMEFPNGSGRPADMLYPKDYRYFEGLAEFVQNEYVGPEDWAMRGMMASLGIVKGEPFAPDARMKEILERRCRGGMKMAQALRFGDKLPNTKYYEDRQWHNVLNVLDVEFKQDSYIDIDARMGMFKIGYSISPAMVLNMVGRVEVPLRLPGCRRATTCPAGLLQAPSPAQRSGSQFLVSDTL